MVSVRFLTAINHHLASFLHSYQPLYSIVQAIVLSVCFHRLVYTGGKID